MIEIQDRLAKALQRLEDAVSKRIAFLEANNAELRKQLEDLRNNSHNLTAERDSKNLQQSLLELKKLVN